MTNGFALNHDKSLQIYFCIKPQAKNDFLKEVESTVDNRDVQINVSYFSKTSIVGTHLKCFG